MTELLKKIFCKKRIPLLIIFLVLTVVFILLCTVLFPKKRTIGTQDTVAKEEIPTSTETYEAADVSSDEEVPEEPENSEPSVLQKNTDELYGEYSDSFMQYRMQETNVYPGLGGSAVTSIKVPDGGAVYLSKFSGGVQVNYIGSSVNLTGNIKSLELPDSVIGILSNRNDVPESRGAFYNNAAIESFLPSEGLQYIGNKAFYGCKSLSRVFLPVSLTHIGDLAFYGCSSLGSISIFGSCSVGDSAFGGCSSLTEVYLSDNVQRIGLGAFEHTPFYDKLTDEFCIVSGVLVKYNGNGGNIVIPDGVRIIGDGVFAGRLSIESVSFPESVEYIGNSAFRSCAHLGEISFSGSVLPVIGENSFAGCPVETSSVVAKLSVDARDELITDEAAQMGTVH